MHRIRVRNIFILLPHLYLKFCWKIEVLYVPGSGLPSHLQLFLRAYFIFSDLCSVYPMSWRRFCISVNNTGPMLLPCPACLPAMEWSIHQMSAVRDRREPTTRLCPQRADSIVGRVKQKPCENNDRYPMAPQAVGLWIELEAVGFLQKAGQRKVWVQPWGIIKFLNR